MIRFEFFLYVIDRILFCILDLGVVFVDILGKFYVFSFRVLVADWYGIFFEVFVCVYDNKCFLYACVCYSIYRYGVWEFGFFLVCFCVVVSNYGYTLLRIFFIILVCSKLKYFRIFSI